MRKVRHCGSTVITHSTASYPQGLELMVMMTAKEEKFEQL